jgi:hypothetical protein
LIHFHCGQMTQALHAHRHLHDYILAIFYSGLDYDYILGWIMTIFWAGL